MDREKIKEKLNKICKFVNNLLKLPSSNKKDWERIQCLLGKIDAMQKKLRMYKEFWDHSHESFLLVATDDGRILDANPAACSLYGYDLRDFKKITIQDISAEPEGTQSVIIDRLTRVPIRHHKNHDQHTILISASVSYFNDSGRDIAAIIVHPIIDKRSTDEKAYEGDRSYVEAF